MQLSTVEIFALVLSIVVFSRHAEIAPVIAPSVIVTWLSKAFLWGPLLVALNRLTEREMDNLRLWIYFAGIIVGIWGFLIYVTGNPYFLRTGIWGRAYVDDVTKVYVNNDAETLVKHRFIVMGLFTVVPSAYWYTMRRLFDQTKQHWILKLLNAFGIVSIIVSVGVSVTRSLIMQLSLGTFLMLIYLALSRQLSRGLLFSLIALTCIIGVCIFMLDFSALIEYSNDRFSNLGTDESAIIRISNTVAEWTYLKKNVCIFGVAGPNPSVTCGGSVDSAVFLYIWVWYGLPGALIFTTLFISALSGLVKSWMMQRVTQSQDLLRIMLTAWAIYYVYIWIVGYSLHAPEIFFTMLFLSEIDRVNGKSKELPSPYQQRSAA